MYKILIADDEPDILQGLRCIINWDEHGIEIAGEAENGADALRFITESPVDILLTDIRMPKLDGLSLIQQLKKDGRDIRCIILSGYDDFKYIKEALKLGIENYLLKPVNREELSATLLGTIDKIESERNIKIGRHQGLAIFRENIYYRWIAGSIGEDELKEKAALAGIDLEYEYFTVAILRLLSKKGYESDKPFDIDLHCVKEICESVCGSKDSTVVLYGIAGDTVILFRQNDGPNREMLYNIIENCIVGINVRLRYDAFASVGSTQSGFTNAHKSFAFANEMQSYSLIMPENSVVDYDEKTKAASKRQLKFVIDFQSFAGMIAAGQLDECLAFIDDIFARLGLNHEITPGFVQNVAVETLYHIVSTVKTTVTNAKPLEGIEADFNKIYSMHTIDELHRWLKLAIERAIEYLTTARDNYSPHVKLILSYINENYMKELSIKQLSQKFNINSIYLGQLFKSETRELFTNYINKIRVDKAKELLLKTNKNAMEISEIVGYPNANYFYRIFKKITGKSPSEFR